MSAEAAAPILADYLYGKAAADLNADEKATISSITGLVGAGVGGITGVDSNLAQGAQSAGTAVDNNWMSDYRGIFGVNQWGPGAVSLVDAKLKEDDVTLEEIESALKDYMTGAGYESGVSDGIVVWMVAPSAGFGAGAITAAVTPGVITMIPSLGTGLKVYSLAALKSVTGGVSESIVLNEDYKISNLTYDLSLGVVVDSIVRKMVDASKLGKIESEYLGAKGFAVNYFLGGGVSNALQQSSNIQNTVILKKLNLYDLLKGSDD